MSVCSCASAREREKRDGVGSLPISLSPRALSVAPMCLCIYVGYWSVNVRVICVLYVSIYACYMRVICVSICVYLYVYLYMRVIRHTEQQLIQIPKTTAVNSCLIQPIGLRICVSHMCPHLPHICYLTHTVLDPFLLRPTRKRCTTPRRPPQVCARCSRGGSRPCRCW